MLTETTPLTKLLPAKEAKKFASDRGLVTVGDLMAFWPRRYRSRESDLGGLTPGEFVVAVAEVKTAQTGADALLVAQSAPPRYVILSMAVPDLKSSDVIAKLAQSPSTPQIIAVHDAPTDEIRQAARASGARMCLPTAAVAGSVRELLNI